MKDRMWSQKSRTMPSIPQVALLLLLPFVAASPVPAVVGPIASTTVMTDPLYTPSSSKTSKTVATTKSTPLSYTIVTDPIYTFTKPTATVITDPIRTSSTTQTSTSSIFSVVSSSKPPSSSSDTHSTVRPTSYSKSTITSSTSTSTYSFSPIHSSTYIGPICYVLPLGSPDPFHVRSLVSTERPGD